MTITGPRWRPLAQLQQLPSVRNFVASEIPVEHAVSLGLPTRRFADPGYAFFASPTVRQPCQPLEQGPPARWWVLHARRGNLLIYAQCHVYHFAPNGAFTPVVLPAITRSNAEQAAALEMIALLITGVVPAFFAGEPGEADVRAALLETLVADLPAPLLPQYRALVPDFFNWLER